MVEYVKLRRGAGLQIGRYRMSPRYVRDLMDRVEAWEPYVVYRQDRRVIGSVLARYAPYDRSWAAMTESVAGRTCKSSKGQEKVVDTDNKLVSCSVPTVRMTKNKAKVLLAVERGRNYGYVIARTAFIPDRVVYRTLYALEAQGLVRSTYLAESSPEENPGRKTYELTGKGQEALQRALAKYAAVLQPLRTAYD